MKAASIKSSKHNTVFQMAIPKDTGDSSYDDNSFNVNVQIAKQYDDEHYMASNVITNTCIHAATHNDDTDGASYTILSDFNILQESYTIIKEE